MAELKKWEKSCDVTLDFGVFGERVCEVVYEYDAEEKQTRDHPGRAEEYRIQRIYLGGTELVSIFDAEMYEDYVISQLKQKLAENKLSDEDWMFSELDGD